MKIRPDEEETAEKTPGTMHPFAEQFSYAREDARAPLDGILEKLDRL